MATDPASTPRGPAATGDAMMAFAGRLYPICRSLTGHGVRATLDVLRERIPLEIHEVASGTQVLDWTVPKEWNVREAYIANARGERVVDFKRHNLHVVQYSAPVRARLTLDELGPRLHTIPGRPDAMPYRTSYYKETWGFCLTDRERARMGPGEYDVVIDSTLEDGHLTYGELYLPGANEDEVLIHAHICHPSLANDNLSGIAVATWLADHLMRMPSRRLSYRFVFLPGLIGPLTWLARNEDRIGRIRHGLVLTGLGDAGPLTYKRSRQGAAVIDDAMAQLIAECGAPARAIDFEPYGYDERQYCSPGFNLPVGALMRSLPGSYPEYHTSDDDLDFLRAESLEEALDVLIRLVRILETNRVCLNLSPKGEPQLGRRGLYRSAGGGAPGVDQLARLWVLNFSDGTQSLLSIARRSGLPYDAIERGAIELEDVKLLERCA